MKCKADPACIYLATPNGKCITHSMEDSLVLTLHETVNFEITYNDNVVENFVLHGMHFEGYGTRHEVRFKLKGGTERRGRPKKVSSIPAQPQSKVPVRAKLRYDYETVNQSITHKFAIDETRCYVIVTMYANGQPGEIFLKVDKVGSVAHGMADAFSTLFSMALQYGIPLNILINKFKHMKFYPSGLTGSSDKDLKFADSIIDYLMRWMEKKFLNTGRRVVSHCHLCNEDFLSLEDSQIHDKLNLVKHQTLDGQKKNKKVDSSPMSPLIGESNA